MITRELANEQIDRLLSSTALHNSESLCKLLRYLAEKSLSSPGSTIKEYQIAVEVFQRSSDFDPQLDSLVRVQAGRLRTKLSSYYASEGKDDRIVVELPRGNYALQFTDIAKKPKLVEKSEAPEHPEVAPLAVSPSQRRFWSLPVLSVVVIAVIGLIALLTFAAFSRNTAGAAPVKASAKQVPASIQIFWGQFLKSSDEPWVVFSNASFVGRPETGLHYASGNEKNERIFDHYTGVGEVLAVHKLDEVFNLMQARIRVKRGSLFTLDELKQNDLIFLGSPAENLNLLDIPNNPHFVFRRPTSGPRAGDLAIATLSPQHGEAPYSLASPADAPMTEDYAVVALRHSKESSHLVLEIAGTTTFGTQGAVEYLCQQQSLDELLGKMGVQRSEDLKPFEALLKIRISRGVPVDASLVSVYKNE